MHKAILLTKEEHSYLTSLAAAQPDCPTAVFLALSHPLPDLVAEAAALFDAISAAQRNTNYPEDYDELRQAVADAKVARATALLAKIAGTEQVEIEVL